MRDCDDHYSIRFVNGGESCKKVLKRVNLTSMVDEQTDIQFNTDLSSSQSCDANTTLRIKGKYRRTTIENVQLSLSFFLTGVNDGSRFESGAVVLLLLLSNHDLRVCDASRSEVFGIVVQIR